MKWPLTITAALLVLASHAFVAAEEPSMPRTYAGKILVEYRMTTIGTCVRNAPYFDVEVDRIKHPLVSNWENRPNLERIAKSGKSARVGGIEMVVDHRPFLLVETVKEIP
jgi:hypothetical protein